LFLSQRFLGHECGDGFIWLRSRYNWLQKLGKS